MLQRRRSIGITGGAGFAGFHPSQRPLAWRNHVIRVSDYYAGPPDDLIDHDISFLLPVRFQVAVRASTDGIAAT